MIVGFLFDKKDGWHDSYPADWRGLSNMMKATVIWQRMVDGQRVYQLLMEVSNTRILSKGLRFHDGIDNRTDLLELNTSYNVCQKLKTPQFPPTFLHILFQFVHHGQNHFSRGRSPFFYCSQAYPSKGRFNWVLVRICCQCSTGKS